MNQKRICFLIGSAHVSGGTYVVLQHSLWLQSQGWKVFIVPLSPFDSGMLAWHPEAAQQLRLTTLQEAIKLQFDIVVATWWKTALVASELHAAQYLYFVQSIESRFFADGELAERQLADATYNFGLPVITEAGWIKEYLRSRGVEAHIARNGIRKDIYTLEGPASAPRGAGTLRVLVEGTLRVPYKNVERTVQLCRLSKAEEVWLMTSTPDVRTYPGADRVFSCVNLQQAAAVYRSCDVLVKLSYVEGMFGPPLEHFHCGGTAIVYDVTGADEYMRTGENSIVLNRDDEEGVLHAINTLHDYPKMLAQLQAKALATAASWPDWSAASSEFETLLIRVMSQTALKRESLHEAALVAKHVYENTQSKLMREATQPSPTLTLSSRLRDKLNLGLEFLRSSIS